MPRANVGEAWVGLTSKITKFMSGIDKADGRMRTMSQNVMRYGKAFIKFGAMAGAAMAAVGTAVAVKGVKSTMAYALELHKLSKTTGITVKQLHRLRYAVEQEHGSFQVLAKSFPLLAKNMEDAKYGLETYTREFKKLGYTDEEMKRGLTDLAEVFMRITDYMANKAIPEQKKMALVLKLLGTRQKDLIPVLKLGREFFQSMGDEVERLSPNMGKLADMAKRYDDAMTKLKYGMMGVWGVLAEKIIPKMEQMATQIGAWLESGKLREWVDDVTESAKGLATVLSPIVKALRAIGMIPGVIAESLGPKAQREYEKAFEKWMKNVYPKALKEAKKAIGPRPLFGSENVYRRLIQGMLPAEYEMQFRLSKTAIGGARFFEDMDKTAEKLKGAHETGKQAAAMTYSAAQAISNAFQKAESVAEKLIRPVREAVLPSLQMRPGEAPGEFRARRVAERFAYRESLAERREAMKTQFRLRMAGVAPAISMFPGTAGTPALQTDVEGANVGLRAQYARQAVPRLEPEINRVVEAHRAELISGKNALTLLANIIMQNVQQNTQEIHQLKADIKNQ